MMNDRKGCGPHGFVNQLLARQTNGRCVRSKPYLSDFSSSEGPGSGTIEVNPGGIMCPPFVVKYNSVPGFNEGKWIAVGDEEGFVSIVNGAAELPKAFRPGNPDEPRPQAQWLAHHNAIFDLAWCQADAKMLTASGDQCVHLWDTASAQGLGQFRGHNGSVKSVCPSPDGQPTFASGARDGALMVWDARCQPQRCQRTGISYQGPVLIIPDAHKAVQPKMQKGRKKKFGPLETKHTVTSVAWLPDSHVVASSGDRDDVVKLWDLRKATLPTSRIHPAVEAACLGSSPSQTIGKRQHGVTCLTLSPEGTRLLVSCSNSRHYLLSALRPHLQPLASFSGHVNGSFYIRACFSGDGTHILSGSSDHKAFIWEVAKPRKPPQVLQGNAGEVTGVAWCSTDPTQIVTCHDNATVSVWTLDRSREAAAQEMEPVLAPVTPGAGQARKERFRKTFFSAGALAPKLSPLQAALDDAAAAGMQAMVPSEACSAPAQSAASQPPLGPQLQGHSMALSPGKAATSACLETAVPAMAAGHEGVPQHSSRLSAEQDMAEPADCREHREDELEGIKGAQGATAEARHGHMEDVPHQSSHAADMECSTESKRRLDTTADAMEPELVPDDDLPLTSLFGSAEAAPPLERNSNRSSGGQETSQKPSTDSAASQPASQESNQENQLPPADNALHRPVGPPGGPPSSPGQPAFNLHVWADRFERRPRSARQPLASITGRASSQGHASQMSRDERPETDPIDFSLLAAMDSRGLGSQPFPVPCTQGTQGGSQNRREAVQKALVGEEDVLSPEGRQSIDVRLPPQRRQAPAQRTPPANVLEEAMGFCRERLSLSPGPECPAAGHSGHEGGACPVPEIRRLSQSRQHGCAEDDQEKENSEAAGQPLQPPAVVPSLLDDGMASQLSVWDGKNEPITGFLKRYLPRSRSEEGGQCHEEAGPLPGDGFMGESPAPRRAVLMQTPLQDRQCRRNKQEEAASMLKRKQPASGAKQRSIMEFFKTPPAQPAQKRSKENGQA